MGAVRKENATPQEIASELCNAFADIDACDERRKLDPVILTSRLGKKPEKLGEAACLRFRAVRNQP
jgi:hypothetical protein